jgi:hypothetical protein
MKYLLLALFVFFLSACEDDKICDPEMFLECHTPAEWQEISNANWKSVNCMNDPMNMKKADKDLDLLFKICNVHEKSRVEFR